MRTKKKDVKEVEVRKHKNKGIMEQRRMEDINICLNCTKPKCKGYCEFFRSDC